ncbi:hypothetical protein QBC36DRAFT_323677 [Triangularia setosa]|uniref:Uncharacterized protein n=1 Tax=Triangularia setosa TaxID=2587417 RepID=A0AAN6WBS7_9PEZI|nr:hypothetical protein QBC36DRAFT_323677 [Podospora setosa]
MCTFTLCHYACKDCGAAIDSQEVNLKPCNKQRKNWDECRGSKKRGTAYHYLKPSDCFYCGDTTFTEEDLDEEAMLDIELRHQPADKLPAPDSYTAKLTFQFTNDPAFDPWGHYATNGYVVDTPVNIKKRQASGKPGSEPETMPRHPDESSTGNAYDPWGQYALIVATVKSKSEN